MIQSALQGLMGSVHTCADAPRAALIETGDFLFLAGDAADMQCETLLASYAHDGRFRILCCKDQALYDRAGQLLRGAASPAQRFAFQTPEKFDRQKLDAMIRKAPDDVQLRLFDAGCYDQAMESEWSRDLCSQFVSKDHYLKNGLGAAALCDGQLIGGASSYIYAQGAIEIEIDVRSDQRRKGIASACAAMLVLECLKRGIRPGWDAANPVSARLAEKLGYVPLGAYPVWLLHEQAALE